MKKFVYLCGMMLLSLSIMAQIDLNDKNWDIGHAFLEEFDTNRSWDENSWISLPDSIWKAYYGNVIHGIEAQIYQYDHCLFDTTNSMMRIISEYDAYDSIPLYHYQLPSGLMHPNAYNSHDTLFYFSGELRAWNRRFKYGYFEIRCRLPQHKGTFPAFWLQKSSTNSHDPYYEEIDIFEHTRHYMNPSSGNPNNQNVEDTARIFSVGIYHNLTGQSPDLSTEHYASNYLMVPDTSNDLSDWHTFGCEWLPDHVYWYLDGCLINSYFDQEHIPCHEMNLIANYAIDRYALKHDKTNNTWNPIWFGSAEMDIDYIHVYQLIWNCGIDEIITCQTDLDSFEYGVKKSVSITSTNGESIISSNDKVTFRVTDSFEVTGAFQVSNGAEFTVLMQDCKSN